MLISCALFAGSTHAWFSDRCSAQITLQSATFDVEVVVTSGEGVPSISPDANGMCELTTGTYTVTLKRDGNATENVGYCVISVGGKQYRSDKLPAQPGGVSFTLKINLSEGEQPVSVTFTPVWSNAEQDAPDLIPIPETGITYPAHNAVTLSGKPEPDEPAESGIPEPGTPEPGTPEPGTPESGTPEPGTPEPGTEEKNNSEEVPSGTDSGSSGTGKTDDEGDSPVDVPLTPGANESANVNANDNALEDQ